MSMKGVVSKSDRQRGKIKHRPTDNKGMVVPTGEISHRAGTVTFSSYLVSTWSLGMSQYINSYLASTWRL